MGGMPGFVYTTYGARDACDKIQGRLPRISETTDAEARQFYKIVNASNAWRQAISDEKLNIFSGSFRTLHAQDIYNFYFAKIVQLHAPSHDLSVEVEPLYRSLTSFAYKEHRPQRAGEAKGSTLYPVVCLRGEKFLTAMLRGFFGSGLHVVVNTCNLRTALFCPECDRSW